MESVKGSLTLLGKFKEDNVVVAKLDDLINQMNLQPNNIPDLDSISIMSGETDRKSNSGGITLNL